MVDLFEEAMSQFGVDFRGSANEGIGLRILVGRDRFLDKERTQMSQKACLPAALIPKESKQEDLECPQKRGYR